MADTGFIVPSTGSSTGWTNATNLTTDNDVTYASKSFGLSETSGVLEGTNYNFGSIPTGSTIDGIEVQVRWDTTFVGFTTNQVQLVLDGTLQGSNQSTGTALPTAWADATFGGATDKWGWTAVDLTDVQDSGFGFSLKVTAPANNGKACYVNTFRIKIYYTEKISNFIPLAMSAF